MMKSARRSLGRLAIAALLSVGGLGVRAHAGEPPIYVTFSAPSGHGPPVANSLFESQAREALAPWGERVHIGKPPSRAAARTGFLLDIFFGAHPCGGTRNQACIQARVTAPGARTPVMAQAAIRGALMDEVAPTIRTAVERAMAAATTEPPVTVGDDVAVEIGFALAGLDEAQRRAVAQKVAPCTTRLARALGSRTAPDRDELRLIMTVRVARTPDAAESWLRGFTDRVGHLDGECKLQQGPLASRIVAVQRKGTRLTVVFERP